MALAVRDPFNVRRQLTRLGGLPVARELSQGVGFALTAREALLPLPLIDRPRRIDANVFPPLEVDPIPALRRRRIGFVGSGGGGACVSLIGVARAFEEAGIRPAAISACSGSAVWGAMWAAGMTAQEMAEYSLWWRPQDYLDVGWRHVPSLAVSALKGSAGLAKADALQGLFDRRQWHMSAGGTDIPFCTIVYNLDKGRVEYLGSADTPEVMLGELVRIAVARPTLAEAVRVEGDCYVDGGVVDAFPAEPLIAADLDHVFGLNVLLPQGDAGQLELARRSRRLLGDKLTLIEPVPLDDVTGLGFYDLFLDRGRWPDLMRRGYDAAKAALEVFRK